MNSARKQALGEHVRNINDDDLGKLLEEYYGGLEMDNNDLANRVEEYWDLAGRNDVDIITLPGSAPHLVSGGMSFGDDPTDSFETIIFLGRVPGVYDLLEKWAREDQAADLAA